MESNGGVSSEREKNKKKDRFASPYLCWGLTAFAVVAASLCFYYVMFHLSNIINGIKGVAHILMPVMFGFIMAYLLTPILNYLEHNVWMPLCDMCGIKKSPKRDSMVRGFGIIVTMILFVVIVYGLCAMMVSQIVPSLMNIINNFDSYVENTTVWINKLLDDNPVLKENVLNTLNNYSDELDKWLTEYVAPRTGELIKTVSLSLLGLVKVLWNFIIGLIISVYLMASKENFAGQAKKMIYACFKTPRANAIIESFRFTHKTFIGFIGGKIVDSIIIGLLCFIGTTLLGTPYAALISVIIGVTNIIPFFGPFLGAVPSIILIFVVDPMKFINCVYFAIFILLLQQFDGNVLGPKVLGNSTGLTGFWVIFSITVFGGFFGIPGMIVGVPVFAVIYAGIKYLMSNSLKKRNLPQDTESYLNVGTIDESGFHEYVPEYKQRRMKRLQEREALKRQTASGNPKKK
ncbi:MAG: AI-2E family transporter [Bacteroidales bacterium]|nr:AI-2E family transporter [Lachnoclostridium sp.]MCM1382969.1 AI-2E family transporter [Lachnoclostridium sp.]MCM1463978.1 AI-2E family transporter [Bacteroidales bacterium]